MINSSGMIHCVNKAWRIFCAHAAWREADEPAGRDILKLLSLGEHQQLHFVVAVFSFFVETDSVLDNVSLDVADAVLDIGYSWGAVGAKNRFAELGILVVVLFFGAGTFVVALA